MCDKAVSGQTSAGSCCSASSLRTGDAFTWGLMPHQSVQGGARCTMTGKTNRGNIKYTIDGVGGFHIPPYRRVYRLNPSADCEETRNGR
jgi:hypothetical protein